ncbi:MAG: hypothetical protein V3W41_21475 [Planctomycetota bacterium]
MFFSIILLVGVLPGIVRSQIALEIATEFSLGQSSEGARSEPVVLGDDAFAILCPSFDSGNLGAPFCNLIVMRRLHGVPLYKAIDYLTSAPTADDVWVNPIGLNSTSILIPGPGADGFYATSDDVLSVFRGLDFPLLAVQEDFLLGIAGPRRNSEIVCVDANTVMWVDYGPDGLANTGEEFVRIIRDLQGSPYADSIPLSWGASGRLVEMEPGYAAAVLSGPDGVFDSLDDTMDILHLDSVGGTVNVIHRKFVEKPSTPLLGVRWPIHIGNNKLIFPNLGRDGRFGSSDDQLVFLDTLDYTKTRGIQMGNHHPWSTIFGPANVDVDENGTIIMTAGGFDNLRGTPNDEIIFISSPFIGAANVDAVALTVAIHSNSLFEPTKSVTLSSGITMIPFRDTTTVGFVSAGVIIIKPGASGQRTATLHDMGETVDNIEALGATSAAVFTSSGAVFHLSHLDQASYETQHIAGIVAEDPKFVTVASKSVMISTAPGVIVNGFYNDRLQLWRLRATLPYGEPTANDQGYEMRLRGDGTLPKIDGPLFWITLESAPPSSFGYLLVAPSRGSYMPASDAEILINTESMLTPIAWSTDQNGNSSFPVIPLGVPELAGIAFNVQFLIVNTQNPRQFELSNGLTMVF